MLRNKSYASLLLLGLVVAVTVTVAVGASSSTAPFSAYSSSWDGTSELRTTVDESPSELTIGQSTDAYSAVDHQQTVAVVLSPTEPYGGETAAIREFVRRGGTLVVAEDYGTGGNELLDAVGAQARINGTPLRDEQNAGPSPAFPKATGTGNHTYSRNVNGLMLNHGSVVEPGNATPVFYSSSFSYLDRNRNEKLDRDETLSRYPVVTVEQVGDGQVVAVSDPSIFLNAMLDESDNRAFARGIVTEHEQVLFDTSHSAELPVLVRFRLLVQQSGVAAVVAGTLSVLLLFWLSEADIAQWLNSRREAVDRQSLSSEEIAAGVRDQHPEWDEERIQRVVESVMTRRRTDQDD